jgi:molybdenum cofactor guanylyltransferase
MIDRKNITGIILAGGKSTRMGSEKGLVLLNKKPFIKHIVETLNPLVNTIIIVSNNPEYDIFNLKRVEDIIENSGPLAGLYSGLFHSKTEHNLVLSCDVPLITSEVLEELIHDFESDFDVIQLQSKNKTMPLIAIYKKQCMQQCLALLQNDERRLRVAVNEFKTKTIVLNSYLEQFTKNINTIEQLEAIQHELKY